MNTQQIFDKVATHLLTQNARSAAEGSCLYRSPSGLKCAVGCLISDSVYATYNIYGEDHEEKIGNNLEGRHSGYHTVVEALRLSIGRQLDSEKGEMLQRLQRMHDREPPNLWESELQLIAERFGLSSKVVVEYTTQKEKENQ